MDCIKDFTLSINQILTFNVPNSTVRCWNSGVNHQWTTRTTSTSKYDVVGFKNINIYGIKLQAYLSPLITSITGLIVEDFSFQVTVSGQNSILGGSFSANSLGAVTTNQPFYLTKYNPEIVFHSPITSVQFLEIGTISAQGYGWQTINDLDLEIDASVIFYYNFEGE